MPFGALGKRPTLLALVTALAIVKSGVEEKIGLGRKHEGLCLDLQLIYGLIPNTALLTTMLTLSVNTSGIWSYPHP